MKHFYKWVTDNSTRFFLILFACLFLLRFCVSCFYMPIRARAETLPPETIYAIRQWLEDFSDNIDTAALALSLDLQNGNLDYTSELGKQAMQQVAIQYLIHEALALEYAPYFLDLNLDIPQTFEISGSGYGGLYYNDSGRLRFCTLYNLPSVNTSISVDTTFRLASSPDFDVVATLSRSYSSNVNSFVVTSGTSNSINFRTAPPSEFANRSFSDRRSYFSNLAYSASFYASSSIAYANPSASIPNVFSNMARGQIVWIDSSSNLSPLCGLAEPVSLTVENVPTSRPWDYYNNTYLPSVPPNFPDKYLAFPRGFNPGNPEPTDPTEPVTNPWDNVVQPETEVIYPTNEDGEPITDENGETQTETVFVTDTTPTDLQYQFNVPSLPLLPTETIPDFDTSLDENILNGLGAIFESAGQILTASGLMGILPFVLGLLAAFWLVSKKGG